MLQRPFGKGWRVADTLFSARLTKQEPPDLHHIPDADRHNIDPKCSNIMSVIFLITKAKNEYNAEKGKRSPQRRGSVHTPRSALQYEDGRMIVTQAQRQHYKYLRDKFWLVKKNEKVRRKSNEEIDRSASGRAGICHDGFGSCRSAGYEPVLV